MASVSRPAGVRGGACGQSLGDGAVRFDCGPPGRAIATAAWTNRLSDARPDWPEVDSGRGPARATVRSRRARLSGRRFAARAAALAARAAALAWCAAAFAWRAAAFAAREQTARIEGPDGPSPRARPPFKPIRSRRANGSAESGSASRARPVLTRSRRRSVRPWRTQVSRRGRPEPRPRPRAIGSARRRLESPRRVRSGQLNTPPGSANALRVWSDHRPAEPDPADTGVGSRPTVDSTPSRSDPGRRSSFGTRSHGQDVAHFTPNLVRRRGSRAAGRRLLERGEPCPECRSKPCSERSGELG